MSTRTSRSNEREADEKALEFIVDNTIAFNKLLTEISSFISASNSPDQNREGAEGMLCMTDSLKPFVDVPFTSEADEMFSDVLDLDLLEHRARWGGAVHFVLASNKGKEVVLEADAEEESGEKVIQRKKNSKRRNRKHGPLGEYVASTRKDGLVYSYLPTRSNNPELLENPSFENVWYAVAYSWQIDGYKSAVEAADAAAAGRKPSNGDPYATRFWGEPVVVYRDSEGTPVCVSDVCPHRSAPLSMGTVENGNLVCFYHGWKFGKDGACVDVPTLRAVATNKKEDIADREEKFRKRVTDRFCQTHRACVEHDGLIWLWRGELLSADPSKLPSRRKGDMETVRMDTVLDYNVDYSYIIENNLDSVHLFYLHDGSVPPLVSIGMMNKNLEQLRLSPFQDDCGMGHLGKLGDGGRPKKLIRFDPPNIVRHGGVSGFEEEFHIIPVAPHRTRVLLRQHIPKGPILSTITALPGVTSFVSALVNNWNYHIGLEDASVMKGQSHLIEDFGAPRMHFGGLGDDLVSKYWRWRDQAHKNLNRRKDGTLSSPYFSSYNDENGRSRLPVSIATGTSLFGDGVDAVKAAQTASQMASSTSSTLNAGDGIPAGGDLATEGGDQSSTWGIKRTYSQNMPPPEYPPMNYKRYKAALRFDDLTKQILIGQEPSCTMIKTRVEPEPEEDSSMERLTAALGVSATIVAVAMNQGMEFAFADIINSFLL